MNHSYTLTEQEIRYLHDLDDYYQQVMNRPQLVWAQHPKPQDYGIDPQRAQQLIALPTLALSEAHLPHHSAATTVLVNEG